MTLSEALRMVHLFSEYWPSAEMSEESSALWAKEIQRYDPEDVMEAALLLGESRQWMPSLAEFLQGIKECRWDRIGEVKPLMGGRYPMSPDDPDWDNPDIPRDPPEDYCSFAEFLHDNPDWAERVKVLGSKSKKEMKGTLGAEINMALAHLIKSSQPQKYAKKP